MKKKNTLFLIAALFFFLKTNITCAQINKQDSIALVDLYNSTHGRHWFRHDNWLKSDPVSTWFGVTVDNNRVSQLSLVGDNLSGTLPSSLGNLTKIGQLVLMANYSLHGSIPPELGKLKNLQYLDLQANQLSGSIPHELGNLVSINYLNLRNNQLSGDIPSELGNLKNLTDLELQTNQLSGNIPSDLGKLISLNVLGLFNNHLTGNIPSALGKLISLQALGLSYNQLSGSIPFELSNLTQLFDLELEHNRFTFAGMETIAKRFSFASYSPQANIYIHNNNNILSVYASGANALKDNTYKWYKGSTLVTTITGDSTYQPTVSGHYSVAVINSVAKALILYSDTVYVKTTININDSLALVDLYNSTDGPHWSNNRDNWLTTAPVSTWAGITVSGNRVTEIRLGYDANLRGEIPSSIGNLSELKELHIDDCNLQGHLPYTIGKLTKLEGLSFAFAHGLTGNIPSSFGNLINLKSIYIVTSKLSGEIPSSLGDLPNLIRINLNDNRLSGNIPSSFKKLTKLQFLDLAFNNLSGTIPDLTNLHSLNWLSLYANRFTFAGMGRLVTAFPFASYSYQQKIHLNFNNHTLSVYAGGANALTHNTYKWYNGSTLVATITGDSTYQPTQSGNYSVAVTNSVATALTLYSDTVYYNAGNNSIASEMNKNSFISVYPNPPKSLTTLSFNADGKYAMTIINVSGKILQTKTGVANKGRNNIQLDVSKYASGVYLITIVDEESKKQTIRLNKE